MSRMLREEEADAPATAFGARRLVIDGRGYENSAAKFWSSLVDEVSQDYPDCDSFTLQSTGSGAISQDLLHPVRVLQRELNRPSRLSLEEAIRQAVADMELFGPEAAVRAALFRGTTGILSRTLPLECADGNVLAYLAGWMLAWAGLPEDHWDSEWLSGRVCGRDPQRNRVYDLRFAFRNRHLSEGLFDRRISVLFRNPR